MFGEPPTHVQPLHGRLRPGTAVKPSQRRQGTVGALPHHVRSLRQDRDEPLPVAIADRLERAIEHNIHYTDEKDQQ